MPDKKNHDECCKSKAKPEEPKVEEAAPPSVVCEPPPPAAPVEPPKPPIQCPTEATEEPLPAVAKPPGPVPKSLIKCPETVEEAPPSEEAEGEEECLTEPAAECPTSRPGMVCVVVGQLPKTSANCPSQGEEECSEDASPAPVCPPVVVYVTPPKPVECPPPPPAVECPEPEPEPPASEKPKKDCKKPEKK